MALTGFDPAVVTTSIGSIISAYNSLIQALGTDMQSNFVGGMADKWACTEATNFFNNSLKPAVDSLLTSADSVFVSVIDSMNGAATNWATATQSSYSPVAFTPSNFKLDVSSIVENIGGVRGIDYENANSVVSQLAIIAQSADAALTNAKNAVTNCGFLGGSQADSLQTSLGTIQSKISEAVNQITTATTNALNTTVTNYGDLAGQISSAFTTAE